MKRGIVEGFGEEAAKPEAKKEDKAEKKGKAVAENIAEDLVGPDETTNGFVMVQKEVEDDDHTSIRSESLSSGAATL